MRITRHRWCDMGWKPFQTKCNRLAGRDGKIGATRKINIFHRHARRNAYTIRSCDRVDRTFAAAYPWSPFAIVETYAHLGRHLNRAADAAHDAYHFMGAILLGMRHEIGDGRRAGRGFDRGFQHHGAWQITPLDMLFRREGHTPEL